MNQKKRPIGITLLAILAGIAALLAIINTLQMLHMLPIRGPFGQFVFFTFDLFGAFMWGILALIYIWVVKMLWSVDAQGWLFLVILTILNLIIAGVSLIGGSSWQALAPTILINGLILIYCLLPGTKAAFLPDEVTQAAPTPATAPKPETETAVAESTSAPAPKSEPVAAAIAATEIATPEEEPEEPTPEMEMEMEMEMEEESEPVAAMVENVDIEAETATAAAAIASDTESLAEEVAAPAPTPAENIDEAAHASAGEEAKFGSDAGFIEGIGPAYSKKLQEVGIDSPQSLLEAGATPTGRKELEEKTGISHKLVMKWLQAADLYRVKGVGSQYAELLVTAGVNTVLELANRNPENLHQKLIEVNEEKQRVREVPSLNRVTSWVEQAKELPRVINY